MTMTLRRLHDWARLPDHTGENRCLPCTWLNLSIAAIASGLVALVSIRAGIAAFAVCAGVIYLRGYLVPGTPTLTRTYLPDRVLRWFDKESRTHDAVNTDGGGDLDVEATLVGAGALEESHTFAELTVSPDFEAQWNRTIDELDEPAMLRTLAEMLDVPEAELSTETYAAVFALVHDGVQIGRWESEAAFHADVGAAVVLSDRFEGWDDLSVDRQTGLLHGLRVYLERCPDCGSPVAMAEETVDSCCSSTNVYASTCLDCDTVLFEMPVARVEQER